MTDPRTWTLVLPYTKPPLSLNARQHHMVKWKREQQVRADVMWLVRQQRVPALAVVSLQVAAGVVPDDTPEFMSRPEPVIHEHRRLVGAELRGARILWVELLEGGGRL